MTPFVVTVALKLPAIGFVVMDTVSDVAVASVTVPTAPRSNVTVLFAAVVSKPAPVIVSVVKLAASTVVAAVIVGVRVAT